MAPPAGARCARHAQAAAVDVCQRCGTFVCGECVNIRSEDVFCPDCARILDRPPPTRPKLAFGLAVAPAPLAAALTFFVGGLGTLVGLGLLLPLIATALALLIQERSARSKGKSAFEGAFYPLAWATLAVDLVGTVGLLVFIARHFADT